MKRLFLLLILLFFLLSCASFTCLHEAIYEAEKVQDKESLLFVEGDYWPFSRHLQLWKLKNGKYEILTGTLWEDKWKFKPTDYFTYKEYVRRIEKNDWLKKSSNK